MAELLEDALENGADEGHEEKVEEPVLGLSHFHLEARHVDANSSNLVEGFVVVVVGVLELDHEAGTVLATEVEVEESVVLPAKPAGLLVDVVGYVGSLDAKTLDLEVEVGVKVAAERRTTLVEGEIVSVDDANTIGNEGGGGGGEREVVDDDIRLPRDELDPGEGDGADLVDQTRDEHLDRVAHQSASLVAQIVEQGEHALTGTVGKDAFKVDKVDVGSELLESLAEFAQLSVFLETVDEVRHVVQGLVEVGAELRELLVGLLAGGVEEALSSVVQVRSHTVGSVGLDEAVFVERTVDEGLDVLDKVAQLAALLGRLLVVDLLGVVEQVADRLLDGVERSTGKRLEDLLELLERLSHVLVGLGLGAVDVDVGLLLGLLGNILDDVGPLVGDRVETVERALEFGIALDAVDDLLDTLEEGILDVVGSLLVDPLGSLISRLPEVVLGLLGTLLGLVFCALEVLLARSTNLDRVAALLSLLFAGTQLALGTASLLGGSGSCVGGEIAEQELDIGQQITESLRGKQELTDVLDLTKSLVGVLLGLIEQSAVSTDRRGAGKLGRDAAFVGDVDGGLRSVVEELLDLVVAVLAFADALDAGEDALDVLQDGGALLAELGGARDGALVKDGAGHDGLDEVVELLLRGKLAGFDSADHLSYAGEGLTGGGDLLGLLLDVVGIDTIVTGGSLCVASGLAAKLLDALTRLAAVGGKERLAFRRHDDTRNADGRSREERRMMFRWLVVSAREEN
ncbi:hypothetical protein PHBOTO_001882 [Pseudozyma hubeiensis]|nr:hypothetical protein PHBOTO_001882 [Pseudozyma hubeiensis]